MSNQPTDLSCSAYSPLTYFTGIHQRGLNITANIPISYEYRGRNYSAIVYVIGAQKDGGATVADKFIIIDNDETPQFAASISSDYSRFRMDRSVSHEGVGVMRHEFTRTAEGSDYRKIHYNFTTNEVDTPDAKSVSVSPWELREMSESHIPAIIGALSKHQTLKHGEIGNPFSMLDVAFIMGLSGSFEAAAARQV